MKRHDGGKRAGEQRIKDATDILKSIGLPPPQQNLRSALTLLSLLAIRPATPWRDAGDPSLGIHEMMNFFKDHYGKVYAENTREVVRRQTIHQFRDAGIVVPNPDNPERAINSGKTVYRVDRSFKELVRSYGTADWDVNLRAYVASIETLSARYKQERLMTRIPVEIAPGKTVNLSPGGQNVLVKQIIDEFGSRFTPGGRVLYLGDTNEKFAYIDLEELRKLGVVINEHGKMADVVVHHIRENWLVLIEAVTSHGPVDAKRREELRELFAGSQAGLVYVTAFLNRKAMIGYLGRISWETEVWVADAPSHLIHFNGERFLGPYLPADAQDPHQREK